MDLADSRQSELYDGDGEKIKIPLLFLQRHLSKVLETSDTSFAFPHTPTYSFSLFSGNGPEALSPLTPQLPWAFNHH